MYSVSGKSGTRISWILFMMFSGLSRSRYTVVNTLRSSTNVLYNDDVIKWKHFPRYWPFVQGIHRAPVNSPHKGQ